ncbi:cutinase family protein [Mycobacterium spongiae]|uniref:Cutinase n=1 Tax=Mycobacterium spongiae TaxID=886343 RepID=A0A975PVU5_9MYCO|nr:cutinase family protein [Mycobacterium spongiae]QUR66475.1 cutinase family protein [Mycobacterium spongiae]
MRLIPVAATAAIVLAPSLTVSAPTAHGASCPDAEVIFARGTDEPPGLGRVGTALVASLREQTGKNIGAYGVDYPADEDFLAATAGANDASDHVQEMAAACPETRLVLGGYSQGAAVIDIVTAAPVPGLGFRDPLPARAAQHVVAVTLFGNPSGRAGRLMTVLSPHFAGKILNLCHPGDPICSNGDQWKAHTSYVPGMTTQAASFVAVRI